MANIKIKNKQGQEVTFTNVPKLTADKVGGGTQDFIIPSGTKQITANGTYDVTEKASAVVNVPNPSSGTLEITENGTYDVTAKASVEVNVSGGGASGVGGPGVKFIDYDGTLVDFWPASDVASKTVLPDNPTGHTRLVAEGWNWALAKIKAYVASYPDAIVTVGQMYHTASGKTELDITLTKVTGLSVTCNNIEGEKDWGDGTINTWTSHTYADYGDYTIKCSGKTISGNIFNSGSSNMNRFWCTAAYIASGVTSIGESAFSNCYSLALVSMPNSLTSIGGLVFLNCYSLISDTIPNGVTVINNNMFSNCYALASVAIPDSVTSIGMNSFSSCHALVSVSIPEGATSIGMSNTVIYTFSSCNSLASATIPDSVTDMGSGTFRQCQALKSITMPHGVSYVESGMFSDDYGIIKYDFSSAAAVPTLTNTNAFSSINGNCKIIVPDALYDDWKAATNWSTYANYIYKASEVAA